MNAGALLGATGFHHNDRFDIGRLRHLIQERPAIVYPFNMQTDRVDIVILSQESDNLMKLNVRLIPQADDVAESQASLDSGERKRSREIPALADQSDAPHPDIARQQPVKLCGTR